MANSYILAIDCGTQSLRAILIDSKGNLTGKEKKSFKPYVSKEPGWAEQDPYIYWESLCDACQNLKEKYPIEWEEIRGVSLTTQRATYVCVDKAGNVIRPAIVWLDQREAKHNKPLPTMNNIMISAVGMKSQIEGFWRQCKSNWIKENQPEIWSKTYKYLLLSGFLSYKLTGKFVDSIACQIGYIPFDYKNKTWAKANDIKSIIFDIEREKLPELVPPGEILGEITEEVSKLTGIKEGIPLISAGSDKGCETLGTGCFDDKCGSISLGSTATIQITTKDYIETSRFMPAYPAVISGCYNPEIEILRGYWMISWFKKEFAMKEVLEAEELNVDPESLLNKRLEEIPPGAHGLILQPYWGAELKMPEAKGSIIGFGEVHTRVHIYRAIIEGINYALLEGIEVLERKAGTKIEKIAISGGGSQSDVICQITADMLNRPVYRTQTYETSALGAAVIGFIGLGVYESFEEAVKEMIHYKDEFLPNKENAYIYANLYKNVYKKIYPKLQPLYKQIKDITKYPN